MSLSKKARVGCSGWSYSDWAGVFYPRDLAQKEYLKFYSRVFDCVEIDSSFYRIPSPFIVEQWRRMTPEGFHFAAKMPKKITHDNKLENYDAYLAHFYNVMSKFGDRMGPIVVQLPPSIKVEKHMTLMEAFISNLNPRFRHAIEFRHKSWFSPAIYSLLEKNHIAMAWSLNQYLETPPETTTDFVYLRLVGDRALTEFSGTQRDMSAEMKDWAEKLEDKSSNYKEAFIFFNNHFAGFGPQSVNEFRRLLGMMEVDWKQFQKTGERQGSLSEF